jgi:hypothetical protein
MGQPVRAPSRFGSAGVAHASAASVPDARALQFCAIGGRECDRRSGLFAVSYSAGTPAVVVYSAETDGRLEGRWTMGGAGGQADADHAGSSLAAWRANLTPELACVGPVGNDVRAGIGRISHHRPAPMASTQASCGVVGLKPDTTYFSQTDSGHYAREDRRSVRLSWPERSRRQPDPRSSSALRHQRPAAGKATSKPVSTLNFL